MIAVRSRGGNITRVFDLLERYRQDEASVEDVVFGHHQGGGWQKLSAGDYVRLTDRLSAGLLKWGVKRGDKVASVIRNGPEWNILDMALMQIGAVQVPIYPTISQKSFAFIFNDSGVILAFASDDEVRSNLMPAFEQSPALREVYTTNEGPYGWDKFFTDEEAFHTLLQESRKEVMEDDLATVIYTSGTTGRPKGVMLSHRNIVSNFLSISAILGRSPEYRQQLKTALSFLPLCHVYERIMNYMYQYMGIRVYYVSSLEFLRESFTEVRPDILCAVPRVLEKAYDRFLTRGRYLRGYRRKLFVAALRLAQMYEMNMEKDLWYRLRLFMARKFVLNKWKKALGGRLKVIVSGGATLNERLARTYWATGIRVMEGYGLTETSPVVSVGTFEKDGVRFGTVGPVIPGVSVRFAADGEILVRGPNVMQGYLNRPGRTREVIREDGWLHTGDIGELVEGRFIRITDRKKEIFKTSGGKYIAPQVLENLFRASDFIENIMVVGEHRNYPAALILPHPVQLESWCRTKEIPVRPRKELIRDSRIVERYIEEVKSINSSLDQTEQLKRFVLLDEEWTIEGGELSPTLKLRRKVILSRHAGIIEAVYRGQAGFSA